MIDPLPGPYAYPLVLKGGLLEIAAALCTPLAFIDFALSDKGRLIWSIILLSATFTVLGIGLTYSVIGMRKMPREVEAGYTTVPKTAKDRREIAYVYWRTGEVISHSYEPRPRSGRRRDVEAHLAKRRSREPNDIGTDPGS